MNADLERLIALPPNKSLLVDGNRIMVKPFGLFPPPRVNGRLASVEVGDNVFISGNCVVHQFVRVGTLALMQGGSAISRDLPPYTMSFDVNSLCGLNVVGLRRAGVTAADRLELKQLYRALFREGTNLRAAVEAGTPLGEARRAAGYHDLQRRR